MQPPRPHPGRGHAPGQIRAAAFGEHELHRQPAHVHHPRGRFPLGEGRRLLLVEAGPPAHVDVLRARPASWPIGDQHQRLVEQMPHHQARTLGGCVHQPQVQAAFREPAHQIRLEADLGLHRHVAMGPAETGQPQGQQTLPQGDAGAHPQRGTVARRQSHFAPRLLHHAQQTLGVGQEAPAGEGEAGTAPMALEQAHAQGGLEIAHAGAHRGLGDVQLAGRLQKAAPGHDGQEGAHLFHVQGRAYRGWAHGYRLFRYERANNIA